VRKNHDEKVAELVANLIDVLFDGDITVIGTHTLKNALDDALAEAYQDGELDERNAVLAYLNQVGQPLGDNPLYDGIIPFVHEKLVQQIRDGKHRPSEPQKFSPWLQQAIADAAKQSP
jgi:hypothetical protein